MELEPSTSYTGHVSQLKTGGFKSGQPKADKRMLLVVVEFAESEHIGSELDGSGNRICFEVIDTVASFFPIGARVTISITRDGN